MAWTTLGPCVSINHCILHKMECHSKCTFCMVVAALYGSIFGGPLSWACLSRSSWSLQIMFDDRHHYINLKSWHPSVDHQNNLISLMNLALSLPWRALSWIYLKQHTFVHSTNSTNRLARDTWISLTASSVVMSLSSLGCKCVEEDLGLDEADIKFIPSV